MKSYKLNMKRPPRILAFVSLIFFIASLSSCGTTNSTNYKITVNLNIDGKLIQASGVQKVSCFQTAEWAAGMGSGGCYLKGEAIPINMGQYGYLFLLMDIPQYYIDKINSPISSTIVNDENGKRYKWDIEPRKMPMFVRFADIKDPKTVQQVHFFDYEVIDYYKEYKSAPDVAPEHRAIMKSMPADASAILGGSVSLISVHVEHTKDWPNFGRIEKVLPWLVVMDSGDFLFGFKGSSGALNKLLQLQKYNFKAGF